MFFLWLVPIGGCPCCCRWIWWGHVLCGYFDGLSLLMMVLMGPCALWLLWWLVLVDCIDGIMSLWLLWWLVLVDCIDGVMSLVVTLMACSCCCGCYRRSHVYSGHFGGLSLLYIALIGPCPRWLLWWLVLVLDGLNGAVSFVVTLVACLSCGFWRSCVLDGYFNGLSLLYNYGLAGYTSMITNVACPVVKVSMEPLFFFFLVVSLWWCYFSCRICVGDAVQLGGFVITCLILFSRSLSFFFCFFVLCKSLKWMYCFFCCMCPLLVNNVQVAFIRKFLRAVLVVAFFIIILVVGF